MSTHTGWSKWRLLQSFGRYIANPLVALARTFGMETRLAAELETVGRKTNQRRTVPVAISEDSAGAWIVCMHGTKSGWGANISANPQVQLKIDGRWKQGIAEFRYDDDAQRRFYSIASNTMLSRSTYRTLKTSPVSVRVTYVS
ncbi:nitroreductase/quinone reductase family protein [Nocardia neocaledoniensis]|uniref:nitroreductase/quinone reductase family protein n=1 Tax=Nocardia neocaledoniensis TaxID=236511 RepID=UPI002454AC84|nr:nitroreductase/quinone reductase family protein [Nocardia neocaledoniensis]